MKIIWTFTLLMIPGVLSSTTLTGYSEGGAKVSSTEVKTNVVTVSNLFNDPTQWTESYPDINSYHTESAGVLSSTTLTAYSEEGAEVSSTEVKTNVVTVRDVTVPEECNSQTLGGCFQNLLEQIENITAQVLPLNCVTNILNVAFNASEKIVESSSSASPTELASYGNRVLKTSEKLISTLVKPTVTHDSVSFTLPAVEGQVFMVGPQVTLNKMPRLDTTNSSVDIDLIGISKNNTERSAAVAFMSYITMENLLKPDFFNTSNDTIKSMMSTVISATLPKTTNTKLTKPVNFTFRHIREFDPSGSLSCVYWNISEWIVDGCTVLKTNSSYTVCSCVHLSTFALIMQTSPPAESDPLLELLNLVCVIVGLVFFSLALLSFALFPEPHTASAGVVCRDRRPSALPLSLRLCVDVH
uniref:GAIN-B domain-containing protein n=1 Tax=Cyprinus carpio carpio TaxID=630221 RepID=A0A9J8CSP0_CYPCA